MSGHAIVDLLTNVAVVSGVEYRVIETTQGVLRVELAHGEQPIGAIFGPKKVQSVYNGRSAQGRKERAILLAIATAWFKATGTTKLAGEKPKRQRKKKERVPDPDYTQATVAEARAFLKQHMDGRRCPCCTQTVKLYRRYITTSMAISLLEIYRYFRAHPDVTWLHVSNHLAQIRSHGGRGGDVQKLRWWGLLERKTGDKRADGSNRVGLYRMTDLGREFVRGNTRVPKFRYLFDNHDYPAPDGDPTVSLREALGENFNYSRLMDIEQPVPPPSPTKVDEFVS